MFGGIYFGNTPFGETSDIESAGRAVVPVWSLDGKTVSFSVMGGRTLDFTPSNSRTVVFTTMDDKALTFALKAETKTLTFSRN